MRWSVLLVLGLVLLVLGLVLGLAGCGCPQLRKPYSAYLSSPTDYKMPPCKTWRRTPKGTPIWSKPGHTGGIAQEALDKNVDKLVDNLEACLMAAGELKAPVRRHGFAVFVPPDWYVSKCSGEQLVPSLAACKLCRAKGLQIKDECCGLRRPTPACPCVCNFRATVQWGRIVVTAPNLKLFKAELARVVLYPKHNNPWATPAVAACVKP